MPTTQSTEKKQDSVRTNGTPTVVARDRLLMTATRLRGLEGGLRDRRHHLEPEEADGYAQLLEDVRGELDAVCDLLHAEASA